MSNIVDHRPDGTATPPSTTTPILQIQDVTFGYSDRVIIDGVSFTAQVGDFISLIGPSGCGKSTLLTMLDGMAKPDSGRVLVQGATPQPGDPNRAMVFQNFALLPWKTVLENVLVGLKYRRKELTKQQKRDIAMDYLGRVGLSGSADKYPRHLSGGMQQRVGLARAFAVQPAILLMDEPFGALDAQNAEILREEVRAMVEQERRTVIFVTHNLDEALQLSSRVLLMSAGPSRFRDDVKIELPDPDAGDYAVVYDEYRSRLWSHLRDEVNAARRAQGEQQ